MAWTTPKTWATSELVTAAMMNTHLRDNLGYLLAGRPAAVAMSRTAYTTTSTSMVDVDATNLKIVLTPSGSRALVMAYAIMSVNNVAGNVGWLRLYGDNGLGQSDYVGQSVQNQTAGFLLAHLYTGMTPGTAYTFTLRYAAGTSSVTINPSGLGALIWGFEV